MKLDFTNSDSVSELIRILETCNSAGFSVNSTLPICDLLEVIADLCLEAAHRSSNDLLETIWTFRANSELRFLDKEKPNALGNSKTVKVNVTSSLDRSPNLPEMEDFFLDLAEALFRIREGHINRSFMDRLAFLLKGEEGISILLERVNLLEAKLWRSETLLKEFKGAFSKVKEKKEELISKLERLKKPIEMFSRSKIITRNDEMRSLMRLFREGD